MPPPGAEPAPIDRRLRPLSLEGTRYPPPEQRPPPGQEPIVMTALLIGILMMGIQLWLLTVALDLYLAGKGRDVWQLALVSGAIFIGGLLMTRLLGRRPRIRRGPE